MSKCKDLTGEKFGKLTVIKKLKLNHHREMEWLCLCDCGNEHISTSNRLTSGKTVCCEFCKRKKIAEKNVRHGLFGTHIHRAYTNMKTRCYNPNYYLFKNYGGKGITICDEWLGRNGLENFYKWSLQNGYRKDLSIDRIDNAKGYSPDNCRWVSMKQQQNNRTNNRMITANGETHTMSEWADISGILYTTIQRRLACGWSEQDAVTRRADTGASIRYRRSIKKSNDLC